MHAAPSTHLFPNACHPGAASEARVTLRLDASCQLTHRGPAAGQLPLQGTCQAQEAVPCGQKRARVRERLNVEKCVNAQGKQAGEGEEVGSRGGSDRNPSRQCRAVKSGAVERRHWERDASKWQCALHAHASTGHERDWSTMVTSVARSTHHQPLAAAAKRSHAHAAASLRRMLLLQLPPRLWRLLWRWRGWWRV